MKYGTREFRTLELMLSVENPVRQVGVWAAADHLVSSSVGRKSAGLANIARASSRLYLKRPLGGGAT